MTGKNLWNQIAMARDDTPAIPPAANRVIPRAVKRVIPRAVAESIGERSACRMAGKAGFCDYGR
jgi:hypothetical protein